MGGVGDGEVVGGCGGKLGVGGVWFGFFCLRGAFGVFFMALAFPCFVSGVLALPLCGAALTFFAAAKKVSKESGLTPPAPKRVPWLGGGSGTSGIGAPAHSAFVTRQSYFPPRTSCSPERAFFFRCGEVGAITMLGNSLSTPWF